VSVEAGGRLERLHLVGADRVRYQVADVCVVDHRRQHLGVPVRDDVAVVARRPQAFDRVPDVVEDVELVVDGENLVALLGRDVDAREASSAYWRASRFIS